MFDIGDEVVYGTHGICKVSSVTAMVTGKEKRDYFVLNPIFDKRAVFYVPKNNERLTAQIRCLHSVEEINKMIDSIAKDHLTWIDDDSKRKDFCSSVIKGGNTADILKLIEMLYARHKELCAAKKHFHVSDERFLRDAERLVNDEFAYVLKIEPEDVSDYIRKRLFG